jgi:hypothetical protein
LHTLVLQYATTNRAKECVVRAGPDCKLPLCNALLGKLWNNTLAELNTASVTDAAAAQAAQTLSVHAAITLAGPSLVRAKRSRLLERARWTLEAYAGLAT